MKIDFEAEIQEQKITGIFELKNKADECNAEACNLLGVWFLSGLNCAPDVKMAAYYFEKAAKLGNTSAMINYALCCAEGRGVPKNFDMAELWIRAASECGDKKANTSARMIFFSTIGHHKPDLFGYMDYLVQSHKVDNENGYASTIKDVTATKMVFENAGKRIDTKTALSTKLTENDIAAYEMMNDVYYGDTVQERNKKLTDDDKRTILDRVLFNSSDYNRTDIAEKTNILYHLCSAENLKSKIADIGKECNDSFEFSDELTWFVRAKAGITDSLIGTYSKKILSEYVSVLRRQLNKIEDAELADEFYSCENTLDDLIEVRDDWELSNAYNSEIVDKWIQKITVRIIEAENVELKQQFIAACNSRKKLEALRTKLNENEMEYENTVINEWKKRISDEIFIIADKALSQMLESIDGDYEKLIKMLQDLRQNESESSVSDKWDSLLLERITVAQNAKLSELCISLEDKNHQELIALEITVKEHSFNEEAAKPFINEVEKAIDNVEKQNLDELISDTNGWTSSRFETLLDKVYSLNYNFDITRQYVDIINQRKNCAQIIETCTDDNLAFMGMLELKECVDNIYASTLEQSVKSELNDRVNSYITLVCKCKDKRTLLLLENCEAENITKHSMDKLSQLKSEVESHQMLNQKLKNELIDRLDIQYSIRKIEKNYANAAGNYDLMEHVLNCLPKENLPEDFRKSINSKIHNSIIDLQKSSLEKVIEGYKKMQHSELLKVKEDAKHFDFDDDVLNNTLSILEKQIDIVEKQKLDEICNGISSATIDDIESLRNTIHELGFKDENIETFKSEIDSRYNDLIFENICRKCTQVEMLSLMKSKEDVENLLNELQSCDRSEEKKKPYSERLSVFLNVHKQLSTDISNLYQTYFKGLQSIVFSEMSQIHFPEFSSQNFVCIFNPERIGAELEKMISFKLNKNEYVLFVFKENSKEAFFGEGFCITNFGIHHSYEIGVKYIPVEIIKDVKAGKLLDSISVSAGFLDGFRFTVEEKYAFRSALAEALQRIIFSVKKQRETINNGIHNLTENYSVKFKKALADTPIPNDIIVEEVLPEIKQKEVKITQDNVDTSASLENMPNRIPMGKSSDTVPIEDLTKVISNLVKENNLSLRYKSAIDPVFADKLRKAQKAYASYQQDEIPLLLEDITIFGSAKEGLVLTNKFVYINNYRSIKEKIQLDRILSAFSTYDAVQKMFDIYFEVEESDKTKTKLRFSFSSNEAVCKKIILFWEEALKLLCNDRYDDETNGEYFQTTSSDLKNSETVLKIRESWLCICGKINEGKFCPNCGAKKETGTFLWKCTCGAYNKGNFCTKCGTRKV